MDDAGAEAGVGQYLLADEAELLAHLGQGGRGLHLEHDFADVEGLYTGYGWCVRS